MRYRLFINQYQRMMKLMLTTAFSILQFAQPAYAENCGPYADKVELAKIYNQQHLCGTCSGQQNNQEYCAVLNHMLDVKNIAKTSTSVEPILIPHRGVWGGVGAEGPAENTMAALKKAKQQGYRIIEIDAMVGSTTKGGEDGRYYTGDQIKMSHYFDMYAYGGESGMPPRNVSDISSYKMRKRNGNLSTDVDDRIASIKDAIIYARDNKLMLTIDPKNPPDEQKNDPDENEYAEIILSTLITAEELNALGYITIKSELTPYQIDQAVMASDSNPVRMLALRDLSNQVLWSPILNKNANVTFEEVDELLNNWNIDTCNLDHYTPDYCVDNRAIMTFEVQVYNEEHWTNKPIHFTRYHYAKNLIDFIGIYTSSSFPSPRRATLWSVDPMGSLGTLGRMYNWKFIGNNIDKTEPLKDDLRSDPVFILSRDGAKISAIITDRPDVYKSILDWE